MKRFFSSQSLNLFSMELEVWEFPLHTHNFYELILIEKGAGKHIVNNTTIDYKQGNIFLLTPDDFHEFAIDKKTKFLYLKFTEQIFFEKEEHEKTGRWVDIIKNALVTPKYEGLGDIIAYEEDRNKIFDLYNLLNFEIKSVGMFSRDVSLDILGAILLILSRNMYKINSTGNRNVKENNQVQKNTDREKISKILSYIRQNINENQKVSIASIAKQFYMSPNYVSVFIKKHTGTSVHNMVMETKIKTAERLLSQSDLTISQIAFKLGFVDASHFNKTFKKYTRKNPKTFKEGL